MILLFALLSLIFFHFRHYFRLYFHFLAFCCRYYFAADLRFDTPTLSMPGAMPFRYADAIMPLIDAAIIADAS